MDKALLVMMLGHWYVLGSPGMRVVVETPDSEGRKMLVMSREDMGACHRERWILVVVMSAGSSPSQTIYVLLLFGINIEVC